MVNSIVHSPPENGTTKGVSELITSFVVVSSICFSHDTSRMSDIATNVRSRFIMFNEYWLITYCLRATKVALYLGLCKSPWEMSYKNSAMPRPPFSVKDLGRFSNIALVWQPLPYLPNLSIWPLCYSTLKR